MYGGIGLSTMADFQNGHAAVTEVQKFCLCFLEYRQGQGSRAGIKVIYAICFHGVPPKSKKLTMLHIADIFLYFTPNFL